MSFVKKLLIPIAGSVFLSLTSMYFLFSGEAKSVISQNSRVLEQVIVTAVSEQIDIILQLAQAYLKTLAIGQDTGEYAAWLATQPPSSLTSNAPEQVAYATKLHHGASVASSIDFLAYLDKDGILCASSDRRGEGTSRADREHFRASLLGNSSFEGPLMVRNRGINAFLVSEPVWKDGKVVGVLYGGINMDFLAEKCIDSAILRNTGYVYVIDRDGQVILHPDRKKMYEKIYLPQSMLDTMSKADFGSFVQNKGEDEHSVTYRRLSNGWTVIAVTSGDILLDNLHKLQRFSFVACFLCLALILTVTGVLLQNIQAGLRAGVRFAERVSNGDYQQRLDVHRNDELGVLTRALNMMVDRFNTSYEALQKSNLAVLESREKADNFAAELATIMDSLNGGVAKFVLDNSMRVVWANRGFYALGGRSEEEWSKETGGSCFRTVYSRDRRHVYREVKKCIANRDSFLELKFRIQTRNGSLVWIYMRAAKMGKKDGRPLFQGLFMDITQQELTYQKLNIERLRNKVVSELTDEIIFDLDVEADIIKFSGNYEKIFNLPANTGCYADLKKLERAVHPNDMPRLNRLEKDIADGSLADFRLYLRLLVKDGGYKWFFVCGKPISGPGGRLKRVIGRLANAHEQKLREERLLHEAQMDALTAVCNKATFERRASQSIDGGNHCLLIIDIDDFKHVNDTYGHQFGDVVISTVASGISDVFRTSDIIGRIGGDEFAVFARGITDEAVIRRLSLRLAETLAAIHYENSYRISLSIGIACSPRHGTNYNDLFAHADSALYHVKKMGKNGYAIYEENSSASSDL